MDIEKEMQKYDEIGFNIFQREEIKVGLESGLTKEQINIYAKMYFNSKQMCQIRYGLEENLDVSIYAKEEFNWKQMYEIRIGLEDGLDISIYAKPEFNAFQMEQIREYLLRRKKAKIK